jgi:hypothetical protein
MENLIALSGMKEPSVLAEAEQIINGPRRDAYGDVAESFNRIASVWSAILKRPVTAREVALCMIGLKLCRESNSHGRDNLVDICGYAELANQVA